METMLGCMGSEHGPGGGLASSDRPPGELIQIKCRAVQTNKIEPAKPKGGG